MTPRTNTIVLAAIPNAVPLARLFARRCLTEWRLHHMVGTAELVVSELVTNAIKASGCPQPTYMFHVRLSTVRLSLMTSGDITVVEVWDRDPAPPVPREEVDYFDEGGRGLLIVDSVAKSWGWRHPGNGGKIVWCQLAGL